MIRIRYPTSATAIGSAREEFRSYQSSGVAEWSMSGFNRHTYNILLACYKPLSSYLLIPAPALSPTTFFHLTNPQWLENGQ